MGQQILPAGDLLSTSRAEHSLDISSIGIPDPLAICENTKTIKWKILLIAFERIKLQ